MLVCSTKHNKTENLYIKNNFIVVNCMEDKTSIQYNINNNRCTSHLRIDLGETLQLG